MNANPVTNKTPMKKRMPAWCTRKLSPALGEPASFLPNPVASLQPRSRKILDQPAVVMSVPTVPQRRIQALEAIDFIKSNRLLHLRDGLCVAVTKSQCSGLLQALVQQQLADSLPSVLQAQIHPLQLACFIRRSG